MVNTTNVSFANSKGGVGKTTSCLAVGCCLAELGYNVLLVDLDHQGNLSDDVGRGDEDYTITDLFENPKFDTNKITYTAKDNGEDIPNLWIIPSDITLAVGARSAERFTHRLHILEDGIKKLDKDFDFILFDLRPAIDLTVENALLLSSKIIVPVDMDKRALKGIDDLLEVVNEVKRNAPFVYTTVITKLDKRNSVMEAKIRASLKEKGYPIARTEIRVSEQYKQATACGRPSIHYAPNKIKDDYMALTKEIIG